MEPMLAHLAVDFFIKGGLLMWPMLICLIAALCVVTERVMWWWEFSKAVRGDSTSKVFNAISQGNFQRAEQLTAEGNHPMLLVVREGLIQAHASMLGAMQLRATELIESAERGQWILGTMITLAPLLGLMGTVTGIMNSFHFVGHEDLAVVKVSGGIAEALIATACGLGIAILCLLPYNYFNRRLTRLRSRLEQLINHVELLVEAGKHHGHDLQTYSRNRSALADEAPSSKGLGLP
jgi:biopolymer transport protein ExbB